MTPDFAARILLERRLGIDVLATDHQQTTVYAQIDADRATEVKTTESGSEIFG